ncbi:MAG: triphosphoribosyl-dephospho-CoA synthase [Muribaculaceae bacterium]|nr:triphosphoribosyl-dephospho-CoA synthase [Muribaculaceae bacterium]
MDSFNSVELREIYLSIPSARRRWERLIDESGLTVTDMPPYAVGIFDSDDNLLGTAALDGDIIKYVAIDHRHRGEAIANSLLSRIISEAGCNGIFNLKIFTKPEYTTLFTDLSFNVIGQSATSVMLENSLTELKRYKNYLRKAALEANPGALPAGVIVMNANPLTEGHLHLIRESASGIGQLFIIPLADNPKTLFSYQSRRSALLDTTRDLKNVTVLEGSPYCISSATFPSYFIKQLDRRTESHIRLDLDIFIRHIAHSLGVSVRFFGEEPTDPLTARYNRLMKEILPANGIETVEIPRLRDGSDEVISASRIRKGLEDRKLYPLLGIVPAATYPMLLAKAASKALLKELRQTPKPGLIDMDNSGAHNDMDFNTMQRSIEALEPFFEQLARASMTADTPTAATLRSIGIEAENEMLRATNGVNTHRGALFSLGLAVSAASFLLSHSKSAAQSGNAAPALTSCLLQQTISRIAKTFTRPDSTNGADVHKRLSVPTALDMAVDGYSPVFNKWMNESNPHLRLLAIMKELEDSNIYHRGGRSGAVLVKTLADGLLRQFSGHEDSEGLRAALKAADARLIEENLSPGGSADMLALSFLLESILPARPEENPPCKQNKILIH